MTSARDRKCDELLCDSRLPAIVGEVFAVGEHSPQREEGLAGGCGRLRVAGRRQALSASAREGGLDSVTVHSGTTPQLWDSVNTMWLCLCARKRHRETGWGGGWEG